MQTDPAVRVAAMDDSELEALHKHLDASPVDDPATVEAHHLVASEMLKRGLDHGHVDDDWSVLALVMDEAVVKSGDELGLPEGMEGTLDEVLKDGGKVTVLLTTNGYVLKAEPTVNDVHVDAIMGAYPIRRKKRKKPLMDESDVDESQDDEDYEETEVEKAGGYDVPAGVREAAKRAMRWISEGQAGDGFTSVGRNRARQLAEGGPVGRDTLVKMRAYFARHGAQRGGHAALEDGEPTPWRVAWDAWGGDAGRAWANRVLGDMEKAAYDPILDVSDRDIALYESYESIAEEFGLWSPEEAHYMGEDDNPFQDQGMNCANCVFFKGGGGCEIVEGQVEAMGLCKLWVIPEDRIAVDEEELLQTMDEDDLAEFGRYASLDDESEDDDDEYEMEKKGNPEGLRDYWRSGGKGKISWGAGGDFTACVAAVSKYMTSEQAKGYCAIRHREVTGMWPGDKRNRTKKSVAVDEPVDDHMVVMSTLPQAASTFTLPDGAVYTFNLPIEKDRSAAGRKAALARWGNRGPDANGGEQAGGKPQAGARRAGMGDSVPISDEDFEMLKAGSAGPHIVGRTPDGAPIFTPERQALHDKIVSEHVDGVPASSDPTYHLMGGGPAAGKSSAIKSGIVDVPGGDKAVQINADDIKYKTDDNGKPTGTSLVDADGISGQSNWASHTHEESSYLAKRIQSAAVERGQDMVLDGTGDNKASSVEGKIAGARAAGYTVKGHYVTCPTNVAVERAAARGERTGRVVPEAVIRGTHAGVSRVVPEVASSFDSFTLVDTSGSTPRKVASATRGEPIKVEDQGLWDAFVAKGSE